jgi:ABC-type uncharacterized transport system ATPase subunit
LQKCSARKFHDDAPKSVAAAVQKQSIGANETSVLGYHKDTPFSGPILLDHGAISTHYAALMGRFDVRPRRPALRSVNFSGGNQ